MQRNVKKLLLIIIFLLGLIIFVYPKIANYLYNNKISSLEKRFEDRIIKLDKKGNDNFIALNRLLIDENNRLFKEKQVNFINQKVSYEIPLIDLTEYGFDENIIGFLEIPSISVKLPIYLGANNHNMKYGAVHLTGSSYPIGGVNTNSVIAAHRGHYKYDMFRHIDTINIGDILYIKNYNEILEYEAVKTDVIKPTSLDKLTIQEGKDMVTIISCHPFPHNYQRFVVYFERKI